MFKDLDKLLEQGCVTFGRTNSTSTGYFCFWQPRGSQSSTYGLLQDIEFNDFSYVVDALNDCECIPFGTGKAPKEA